MQIDLKSINPATAGAIKYSSDCCPYFLPVPVYGQGCGDIEALSSYICRQAEMVGEWAHSYTTRLFEECLQDEELPRVRRLPYRGTHAYNSIGVAEQRLSKAVTIATESKIIPELMTLRCIEYLTDFRKHGLMRDHIAWCKTCWQQDIASQRSPYLRLYWTLQHTTVCVHHNEPLQSLCPSCGTTKLQFPKFPRQHICDKCGQSLLRDKKLTAVRNISDRETWFSRSVFKLLEAINREGHKISTTTVAKSLKRIMSTLSISRTELANFLESDNRRIEGLLTGERRPYFPALMDICYRMDIPPHELLFSTCNLTTVENWRMLEKRSFVSMSKLTPQKKNALKQAIDRALQSDETPPPQVSKIATEFGIKYTTIQQNFETEYNELVKRRIKWERQLRKTRHQHRIESLCEGVFKLARTGKFPSERNIRKIGAVKPHELRRYDLSLILSAFQQIYTEQGLIDEETIE